MSAQLLASKIVVLEEQPSVRAISSAPTQEAAILGTAERGPIGKAVLCTSPEEYSNTFGGFAANADLPLAVMGFFENGGTFAWIVRTAHYADVSNPASVTAVRATANLVSGAAPSSTNALRVEGKDPGGYANQIDVVVRASSSGEAGTFDLVVDDDGEIAEQFANVTMNPASPRYVETIVNDEDTGSALIRVIDQRLSGAPTLNVQTVTLGGGNDGLVGLDDADYIGSAAGKTGLNAFNEVQTIALLLAPGRATPAVHNAMVRYCEVDREGFVFPILDPPAGASAQEMVNYVESVASLKGLSEHGAIYWPRVRVANPAKSIFGSAKDIVVPPSGIIAGVFARTAAAREGGIYDAPAGIENGRMFGVLGFETNETLDVRKRDLVYPRRINPLTTSPGKPRFIDGSRTLKGDGNYPGVAARRGVSFIERSLKEGLEFTRHRNNNEELRAEVQRSATAFLRNQMNDGAFQTRDPKTAFFVDMSLNTPAVVASGRLIARVGLNVNEIVDWVVLRIVKDTRALEASL